MLQQKDYILKNSKCVDSMNFMAVENISYMCAGWLLGLKMVYFCPVVVWLYMLYMIVLVHF